MKKIIFILNPKAGHGLNRHIEKKIEEAFGNSPFVIEKVYTQYAGHATELSRKAASENYDAVVAIGGDGTVNEVAAGLTASGTALGIIPAGSGNGFANFLKIPHDAGKALAIIKNGKSKTIDSFTVNNRFGINVTGVGFDAFVAHQFAHAGKRGFLTYIKLVMKSYFGFKEQEFEIDLDGRKIFRKAFLTEVANGAEFGNHAVIAPPALADDGWLDVVILRKNNLFNLPFTLFRIFSGQRLQKFIAEYLRAKKIVITSSAPFYIHVDGEAAGIIDHAVIEIHPGTIRVLC
jgi:YegS/Rv2252/BmrU family lipid kinase